MAGFQPSLTVKELPDWKEAGDPMFKRDLVWVFKFYGAAFFIMLLIQLFLCHKK